jgi:hypothetical protein
MLDSAAQKLRSAEYVTSSGADGSSGCRSNGLEQEGILKLVTGKGENDAVINVKTYSTDRAIVVSLYGLPH